MLVNYDCRDLKATKQFKFEILWAENEKFGMIIKEGWEAQFQGFYDFQLVQK